VILNWEMEFKKFFPGMKVLTYYGNQKERKEKRVGWATDNFFQVCITSYQLVLADQHIFRRKNWQYLILDEAHNIKNFRSQRWQTLLGFKSNRRLLLTGTPLQNNLMELWSLMYFLMPNGASGELSEASGFANHREFSEWFSSKSISAAALCIFFDLCCPQTRWTRRSRLEVLCPTKPRRPSIGFTPFFVLTC
jgi:helicase SWR1